LSLQSTVFSLDEEGGRVGRLPLPFPRGLSAWQMGMGPIETVSSAAFNQSFLQGSVLNALGFGVVFAPVADLLTEPNNPVMQERCFGSSVERVELDVVASVKALEQSGIRSCVKHFPGHGNTLNDSHEDFASSDVTIDVCRNREWIPFQKAFDAGCNICMTAHVKLEKIDPYFPATLSKIVLQNYLRNDLNFGGLIVSDDMRMNAIAKHYGVHQEKVSSITLGLGGTVAHKNSGYLGKAACDALEAGCNVVVCSQSILLEVETLSYVAEELKKNEKFANTLCERAFKVYEIFFQN
jgi:beta-N-acetylhexosaminidase